MPAWITVYCRRSVESITSAKLLDGINDRDRSAGAGGDYDMLAETYGLDEDSVEPALEGLRIEGDEPFTTYELRYRPDPKVRPVFVHRWADPSRVAEEIAEVVERLEPSSTVIAQLQKSVEIVALELGFSQLGDMGVVFAYEVARYLAQKGDGLILDVEDHFTVVERGAFKDM
jgi:hypothetical protein